MKHLLKNKFYGKIFNFLKYKRYKKIKTFLSFSKKKLDWNFQSSVNYNSKKRHYVLKKSDGYDSTILVNRTLINKDIPNHLGIIERENLFATQTIKGSDILNDFSYLQSGKTSIIPMPPIEGIGIL